MKAAGVLVAVALCAGLLVAAVALASHEADYAPVKLYPRGGLHGGDAWVIPLGQIQGVRDIQCGRHTGRRRDLNCDIGAGSSAHRGDISLNWDVGRCTVIYDGRKRRIARFCPRRIDFYAPVRIRGRRVR